MGVAARYEHAASFVGKPPGKMLPSVDILYLVKEYYRFMGKQLTVSVNNSVQLFFTHVGDALVLKIHEQNLAYVAAFA